MGKPTSQHTGGSLQATRATVYCPPCGVHHETGYVAVIPGPFD
jgi:hypothetical protein